MGHGSQLIAPDVQLIQLMKNRVLLHLADGSFEAVEGDEIFYCEAAADDTRVRLRGRRERRDVRPLGELERALGPGFFRPHRSFVVNLGKVRLVRRRSRGRDWELRLEPPVNRVLPVSRTALPDLLEALGR